METEIVTPARSVSPEPVLLTPGEVLTRVNGDGYEILSARQLDWWDRNDVIESAVPANGAGTRRRFTFDQCATICFVARLRVHAAASLERWASAVGCLKANPYLWAEVVVLTSDGRLERAEGTGDDGPRIDLIDVDLHAGRDLSRPCPCRYCQRRQDRGEV